MIAYETRKFNDSYTQKEMHLSMSEREKKHKIVRLEDWRAGKAGCWFRVQKYLLIQFL